MIPLREQGAIAGLLARGEAPAAELVDTCPCGARLRRMVAAGLARCDACVAQAERVERTKALRERIPAPFRWADLGRPLVPPGAAVGAAVVAEEARAAAAAWLGSGISLLTITGPATGSGKTTLGAAVALAAITAGASPVWVSARDLDPMHADQERARAALRRADGGAFVVLDGLGKELAGAGEDAGAGVAAQRRAWMQRWIADIHEADGRRFVVTVDLTSEQLMREYGSDALRRLAGRSPHVTVINLQRRGALDVARF